MALFNLTGISLNKNQQVRTGSAGPLMGALGAKYENNIYRYPQDIGNYDKGHYMVIHINEQIHTSYGGELTGDDPTIIANRKRFGTPTLNSAANQIVNNEQISNALDVVGTAFSSAGTVAEETAKKLVPAAAGGVDAISGITKQLTSDLSGAFKNYAQINPNSLSVMI